MRVLMLVTQLKRVSCWPCCAVYILFTGKVYTFCLCREASAQGLYDLFMQLCVSSVVCNCLNCILLVLYIFLSVYTAEHSLVAALRLHLAYTWLIQSHVYTLEGVM